MKNWVDIKAIRVLWASFAVYAAIYLSSAWWPVSTNIKDAVLGIMYLVPVGAAATGALNAVLAKKGRARAYWFFVFAAMAAMFVGEGYWVFRQIIDGSARIPAISFTTTGFVIGYVFLFISVFVLWSGSGGRPKTINGLLVTVAMMMVAAAAAWYFQFAPIYTRYAELHQVDKLAAVIYPILDIALVVGMCATAIYKHALRWPPWLVSIIIGLVLYTFGDIAFTYFSIADAYTPGAPLSNVVDVLWLSFYVFIFNGAMLALKGGGFDDKEPEQEPEF
jgi:hypothetical protein